MRDDSNEKEELVNCCRERLPERGAKKLAREW
jgi:hypothetical protein